MLHVRPSAQQWHPKEVDLLEVIPHDSDPFKGDKWYILDGENNGKPYVQMDDLGGFPIIFGNTQIHVYLLDLPPHPRIPVANEGVGWDSRS